MMMPMNKPLISTKEMLASWCERPVDPKTFRRHCQIYGLKPVALDGRTKLYHPDEVQAAQRRRKAVELARLDRDAEDLEGLA